MGDKNRSLLWRTLGAIGAMGRVPAAMRADSTGNPVEAQLRRELYDAAREVAARGLSWGLVGCMSARMGSREALISPAGTEFRALTDGSFVLAPLGGESDPALPPNWPLHRALLLGRPEAKGILQVQPPHLSIVAAEPTSDLPPVPELADFWKGLACVDPASEPLPEALLRASEKSRVILVPSGGLICWSPRISDLPEIAGTAEAAARMIWIHRVMARRWNS